MTTPQPPTRRGQEFALKADQALREGKIEEAKLQHKNAWNAFKEARDALMEGDTNTKMALKILIDYHRDREKNPGDPKHVHVKPAANQSRPPQQVDAVKEPQSAMSSGGSLPEAWAAVHEFGDLIQSAATPPPLPEFNPPAKSHGAAPIEWRKGHQSMMMAESFLIVGGDGFSGGTPLGATSQINLGRQLSISSPDRSQSQNRVVNEIERLTKEVQQLRLLITKEREESKIQKEKFWKMFVVVKAALEESNHESDLKALTRLLHNETEARKKAEAELEELRRRYS